MKVQITIEVVVQRASNKICKQFCQRIGTFEVLSEGDRIAWAETTQEGIEAARGLIGSELTTSITTSE